MQREQTSLGLDDLRSNYSNGNLTPSQLVHDIHDRLGQSESDGVWTFRVPQSDLQQRAADLEALDPGQRQQKPLWGIPFSVKDCIDIAGMPTSCACKAFVYTAQHTNPAVQKLLDAGALLIGKTNLDQFATGVVGVRSDYGIARNPFAADYIPGGSSSGAAVSVAQGLVTFAVGTDTGGSGRVPAGFNNVVGLKPTRGLLSARHMVPACRSLDCVSLFSLTAEEAYTVLQVAKGYDPYYPLSRQEPAATQDLTKPGFRFGVPAQEYRQFFGNSEVEALFDQAISTLKVMGGSCLEVDYRPFLEVNDLLFRGAWIAERYGAVGTFVEENPEQVHPSVRQVILKAKSIDGPQVFADQFKLAGIQQSLHSLWQDIDVFVVPTTGTIYTIAELEANPIELNFNLGYYTNFVNLLDLAAVAVPNGFQSNGLPSGVTLIGKAFTEKKLVDLGSRFHQWRTKRLGATVSTYP